VQPGGPQRLEGVDQVGPAAQRHQPGVLDTALGPGHLPAQHQAVVAGPLGQPPRVAAAHPQQRGDRVAQPGDGGADGGVGTLALHDPAAQRDGELTGAVGGGAGPLQPLDLPDQQLRLGQRVPGGRHGQAGDHRGAGDDALRGGLQPPQLRGELRDVAERHLHTRPQHRLQLVADGPQPRAAGQEPAGLRGLRGDV